MEGNTQWSWLWMLLSSRLPADPTLVVLCVRVSDAGHHPGSDPLGETSSGRRTAGLWSRGR
jgi:hypothetical protein